MINHARTLLLNRDGSESHGDDSPGEEVVPRDFRAIKLPTYLEVLRSRLFGTEPDRATLNYRLAQFTAVMHATELAEFVFALDPRVTYLDSPRRDLFNAATFTPTVPRLSGAGGLAVQDGPSPPEPTGKMRFEYTVESDGTNVTVRQYSPRSNTVVLTPDFSGGMSTAVPLTGSGYSVLVPVTPGSWQFRALNRPVWSLGSLVESVAVAGEPVLQQLFGRKDEPYATFRNLFNGRTEMAYRLGAVLLAMVYRTDAIRRAGNG